jgi:hypothetical protein
VSDAQCSTPAAPGNCPIQGGPGPGNCTSDSSCTAGVNGRCAEQGGGVLYCACTYDTCMHDTDCATGKTCACHGSPYAGGDGNTCMPGDCRVDADCGAGGYCSPSYDVSSCGSLGGYYCHTPKDLCVDDADCQGTSGPAVCTYVTTSGRWECRAQQLCG